MNDLPNPLNGLKQQEYSIDYYINYLIAELMDEFDIDGQDIYNDLFMQISSLVLMLDLTPQQFDENYDRLFNIISYVIETQIINNTYLSS